MSPLRSLFRPAPRRSHPARGLAALAALVGACNDSSPTSAGSRTVSASAVAYVDTALLFEQEVFYYGSKVNFPAQRSAVTDSNSRTRSQGPGQDTLYYGPVDYSIEPFLRNAGDEHSAFFRPDEAPGASDAPADDPRRNLNGYMLPASAGGRASSPVAYLWYPAFTGRTNVGHVDSSQTLIRTLDQNSPCGYILDLRLNYGGSIFPMLAGVSPLTGNAPVTSSQRGLGGWVDYTQSTLLIYSQNGAVGYVDPNSSLARRDSAEVIRATTPYTLRRPNTPVAVLTGPYTASAGEFITLSFRGGAVPFRVFGEPTYGVTTVPYNYDYKDGAFLNITAALMADRTLNLYGSKLVPDQTIVGTSPSRLLPAQAGTSPDAVVQAAVAWLNTQPSCGGTTAVAGAAARGAPRDAAGVAPATPVVPRTKPAPVSPYWGTRAAARFVQQR